MVRGYSGLVACGVFKGNVNVASRFNFQIDNARSRLLLLTFEESDIFVRATAVNHDAGKLPTLRSLSVRLIE
jgi:hypothetical protein